MTLKYGFHGSVDSEHWRRLGVKREPLFCSRTRAGHEAEEDPTIGECI
jgi:hypothetical protein